MAEKNPLDEIVAELVVFKHEDPNTAGGQYVSNNPMWNDSRIRERWLELYSDEAQDFEEVEEEDTDPDYESMTNDQLRGELARRNLSVDGKKADLIDRLIEDDEQEPEEV